MDISNVDLLKLQTKVMQNDSDVQGFAAALNAQFQQLAGEIINVLTYSRIDQLSEEVLDILAWQFAVDWYDATSDLATKRQAINDALKIYRIRGTPAAVQRVVEIYFGDGVVEEWWEYGAVPYHFRVTTNNSAATNEKAALLSKAVQAVKRLSAVFDGVVITDVETTPMYFAGIAHTGEFLTVKQVVT
ncbi:phage tail protein I [Ferviditalea candida]|uniref:Phage tail protein I n=1 Tax=Ferviditalea candida TaxID=3108399 RepID=A0ABU5ZKP4_9BACL|nr:phage tail protein I [Paenibacillaceae bacterium T2]